MTNAQTAALHQITGSISGIYALAAATEGKIVRAGSFRIALHISISIYHTNLQAQLYGFECEEGSDRTRKGAPPIIIETIQTSLPGDSAEWDEESYRTKHQNFAARTLRIISGEEELELEQELHIKVKSMD